MEIIGISLKMQEKILRLIKSLVQEDKPLTGAIIMIEGVGPGFCWGVTSQESLKKAAEYFCINDREYKFSFVELVLKMPAGKLMQKMHLLRDKAGLPGIFKYLELHQKAA